MTKQEYSTPFYHIENLFEYVTECKEKKMFKKQKNLANYLMK